MQRSSLLTISALAKPQDAPDDEPGEGMGRHAFAGKRLPKFGRKRLRGPNTQTVKL
jgi:hypothetical protein